MERRTRILVVDDNIAIHNDFKKVLGQDRVFGEIEFKTLERELFLEEAPESATDMFSPEYDVDSAMQGQEALEMVTRAEEENDPYSVVFMDVRMPPGWDGIKTISKIWNRYPHIEMVICTAYSDYSWEKIIEELGTTDRLLFLRKPFDTTAVKQMALSLSRKWALQQQAKRYVQQLETEITERRRSEEKLDYLAHHDMLTGLANRTQFHERLQKEILGVVNGDVRFAIYLIDLDRFREINDTLGYHNGDEILKQTASRLNGVFGKRGMVARFSGDEFAIFLPSVATRKQAVDEAIAIQQAFEPLYDVDELQLEVGASIGVVLCPDHGADPDTLMRRVDMTMSVAKKTDPGYALYDSRFDHYSAKRLTLLGELRQAIFRDNLEIFYQPKISMRTEKVQGFEALVRWLHPLHGRLSPIEFVPLAERSGLIKPLSLWVLRVVAADWVNWFRAGVQLRVSVNLSARDLLDSHLPSKVADILDSGGMDPNFLVLEITESAMMEDPEFSRHILVALSQMGIKLSIDDFGTGYSSLAYLKNLPVDEIKIDQSFVKDIDASPDNVTIVKSTIDLGHTLGLRVVAEGIETAGAWNMLKKLDCDLAQGFFLGRPASIEDTNHWLRSSKWGLGELVNPG